jgi:hypothetical protein
LGRRRGVFFVRIGVKNTKVRFGNEIGGVLGV